MARPIVYAAYVPEVQKTLYDTFADEFDSATGIVACFFALGMVKSDIAGGIANAAPAPPLDRMAAVLLATRPIRACFR